VGSSIYTAAPGGGYVITGGTSLSSPIVAGAAAMLKAARPGLSVEQYRSLLINSASTFALNGTGTPVNVQQGGAGLLNMQEALTGTVTAYPSSVSFAISGGTVTRTQPLRLTSLLGEADTLTVEARPIGSSVVPELEKNSIDLAAGATEHVNVRFAVSGLEPGAQQGFVVVRSSRTGREVRIPYWHGVPSQVPHAITTLSASSEGATSSRRQIIFRVTDRAGLSVGAEPEVSVTEGDGRVTSVTSIDGEIPGAWLAVVRLGPDPGANTFRIKAGDLTRDISIRGN
jgi:hypothetical protein